MWRTIRHRHEWRVVEAKVAEMAFERRRQVKKQSQKAKHKDSSASSAAASMQLKAAVQENTRDQDTTGAQQLALRGLSKQALAMVQEGNV